MAYETGQATSQENFVDKLKTFLGANGWTVDNFDTTNDRCTVHRNSVFISFRWDNTTSIAVFQALGFVAGPPENNTNDSGIGDITGTVTTDRRISDIGNGPYPNYYFFESHATQSYFHAVLEFSPGIYRAVSAGELSKFGTWTGGEFCAATVWDKNGVTLVDPDHNVLMDGFTPTVGNSCSVHVEGLPGYSGTTKWGLVNNGAAQGNDRAGNPRRRLGGGFRDGWMTNAMDGQVANPNNGFISMWPITIYDFHDPGAADEWRMLGIVPDLRVLNGKFLQPAEELVVGSDTWKVFPWCRKSSSANDENSGNLFMGVKKIP
jgi:hypothetical protein